MNSVWSLNATKTTENQFQSSNWSVICVTWNTPKLSTEENVFSEFRFSIGDSNKPTSERMEMATLRMVNNKTVDCLISKHQPAEVAAEAAKKEKARWLLF